MRVPVGVCFAAVTCLIGGTVQAQEFKVSGQLNRLLMRVDDGTRSRGIHADNVNSQTRLRITAAHDIAPWLKVGANWENGYTENPSSLVDMNNASVDATVNKRHADIYFLGEWGKLSVGRGDGAANGGMECDLSGTTVISYSGITDIGGGFAFRGGAAVGPTIAARTTMGLANWRPGMPASCPSASWPPHWAGRASARGALPATRTPVAARFPGLLPAAST